MKRLLVIAACALSLPLAVLAASAGRLAPDASAHLSDCHGQQTCPSDDHSYVWYDEAGRGWDCASTLTEPADPEERTIVFDGLTYVCYASGLAPTTTAETNTTATTTTTSTTTASVPTATAASAPPPPPPPVPPRKPSLPAAPPLVTPPAAPPIRPGSGGLPVRPYTGPVHFKPSTRGYVFPVYGPSSFIDTFGAARADVAWHHGDDIFAPLGAPVLAVADGTVFSVGWNDIGGNRLWLRDEHGWQFYYAHLSAFTPQARNGAHVRAGTVLGFVGNTGDAATTPYHLHFEIHPFSLLYRGYDGAIDPTPFLTAWKHLEDISLTPADRRFAKVAGWALGGSGNAPEPGAVLLQSSDISSASGLDRSSLLRAYAARVRIDQGLIKLRGTLEGATPDTGPARPTASAPRELGGSAKTFGRDMLSFAGPLIWDVVAQCEAGGDWGANTGNGFYGGLQFLSGTWARYGGYAFAASADEATREEQITVAERVLASEGWMAWPSCSAKLGLR